MKFIKLTNNDSGNDILVNVENEFAAVINAPKIVKEKEGQEKRYTEKDFETMTIAEVREATGLEGRSKQKLVQEYLHGVQSSVEDTEDE